jgi:hypothetical protein
MTMSLSEAGRLYLSDADVLEEARGQLDQYLGAAWDAMLSALSLQGDARSCKVAGRSWSFINLNGSGRCSIFDSQPQVAFQIGVCDPFRGDDKTTFTVWLQTTKGRRDRVERARAGDALAAVAQERSFKFDLRDPDAVSFVEIPVDADDAEKLGQRVAAAIMEFLEHSAALQAAFEKAGLSTST